MSNIEWTDETWQVTAGCKMVSPGCANCYAETMAKRLQGMAQKDVAAGRDPKGKRPYLHVLNEAGKWNGTCTPIPENLNIPLGWKKPRRIFVNSMSDLFHEDVPFEFIDRHFAMMALCPQHTFQVLTKRPERMAEYLTSGGCFGASGEWYGGRQERIYEAAEEILEANGLSRCSMWNAVEPLPNVWLGTSVEDQARADERIPWLLKCPAAVRFLSVEPMLGAINLHAALRPQGCNRCQTTWYGRDTKCPGCYGDPCAMATHGVDEGVDWVIVGGESGPGARPCNVEWIRSIVGQCKAAGVPVFVKQLGANVQCRNDQVSDWLDEFGLSLDYIDTEGVRMQGDPVRVLLNDPKGGDLSEWPADLRVREMPGDAGVEATR